ncbi:MAG: hypothetical protein U1E47_01300 [Rivihabitans pingtungensis]
MAFAVTTFVSPVRMVVKADLASRPGRPERQGRGHHHRHHLDRYIKQNE